jgi:hypothetical protein
MYKSADDQLRPGFTGEPVINAFSGERIEAAGEPMERRHGPEAWTR